MIEWMLIIALGTGYELHGAYKSQEDCQKAGIELMTARYSVGKPGTAGCYKKFSVMTSKP
ncbi:MULTISPECIES: hypothetical protein [Pseudomonas syringae group genomosp. 2]|uniref:Uncharacterized protein n=4 Tax=Pseudomonas syringae group TaxID=136849 RepID=A0A3M4KPA3_PSEA0|nr:MULTISPECIES: hypothetical protein [Pseudomonas syringae group genomosp. 2]KPW66689.1 hypothetical protein ALO82_200288 [Pseudomonas syringae pv. broussonetiae]KPX34673.1 Unknown protein sequence [Pseudomonas ficuserectae]KPX74643.1 hypothetical protein ALO84_200034 [Pseudomonas syringae pv. maculicola]RMO84314.1 hypothetical protein ALQ33_00693 [Pseudomonas syringae pv. philadelphi]KWS99258.1 hypothetical protein AL047_07650 [Pseudomonas syringae pv. broussonetiae]